MKVDETFCPVDVSLIGAQAAMPKAQSFRHLIERPWRLRYGGIHGERRLHVTRQDCLLRCTGGAVEFALYCIMSHDVYITLARAEHEAFARELAQNGPIAASDRSSQRLDRLIQSASATSTRIAACQNGCNYCCYYRVDVSADEVLLIRDFVHSKMSPEQRAVIKTRAESNSAVIAPLSVMEHMRTNVECCFLINGSCSIYPVRPLACRSFHATDVQNCLRSFQEPENLEIPNSFVPEVHEATEAHKHGRAVALAKSGNDCHMYEFQTAVHEALSSDGAAKRFRKGKRSYIQAKLIT